MRLRVTMLCAVALATAAAVATPALAGSTGRATPRVGLGRFGTPSQIPWGSVGSGWVLADWGAGVARPGHPVPAYLVLVNQAGQRYLVLREQGATAGRLLAWSGDGQRALLEDQSRTGAAIALVVVDLRSGAVETRFDVPKSFGSAGFTKPHGYAIDVLTSVGYYRDQLTRYSFNGQAQVAYPRAFSAVGPFQGSWVSSPDGTELVLGAKYGLAVVANDGALVSQLRLRGASGCTALRYWSTTTVLASCSVGPRSELRLFEFHVSGGAPVALTRNNVAPDLGDISGWRLGTHVYVEVASACGYIYLARLQGAAPIMVHIPGVPNGNSVYPVGVSRTSLAFVTNLACHGGPTLRWYTPSTNTARIVLGPPATGGGFGSPLIYPSPLG